MTENRDYGLIIGIAHYPHLRRLEGPIEDARQFANWLKQEGNLPEGNVKLIESVPDESGLPVLAEVESALDDIIRQAEVHPGAGRRLYVYFAGHGCAEELEHVALLMANAREGHFQRAALDATQYRRAMAIRAFPEQLYLFDCCRFSDPAVRGLGPNWDPDRDSKKLPGLVQVVMYAAGFKERAWERRLHYDERRGLFTVALMEGLLGAASREGVIKSDRLASYVQQRVEDLARQEKLEEDQNCDFSAYGSSRPLILAKNVTAWERRVTVALPRGTRKLRVTDESDIRVKAETVPPGDTDIILTLPLGWYTISAESDSSAASSKTIQLLPGKSDSPYAVDLREGAA
ncbi:caspase domain-containing protein [Streptomyces yangpuensis]|uniref:caspase family protein n=1 Tax=Streptomyces yangpuensis TaxID=1648182 RepID=UPI0036CF4743